MAVAFLPSYPPNYALAVLVILPHTFILELSLVPFVLWRAWRCPVGLNFLAGLALSLGVKDGERSITGTLHGAIAVVCILSPWCVFANSTCSHRHYRLV